MGGDPIGSGGQAEQFHFLALEIIFGLVEVVMQTASDWHTRQARMDRAEAQLVMDRAKLEAINEIVSQIQEMGRELEDLTQAVKALEGNIENLLAQILSQQDDLRRSVSIVAAYRHFILHRQELLQREGKWNDRAAIDLYGNEIHRMRLAFQREILELQELWNEPHESPQRLATMAAILIIELEMDAELEALGREVNSAPLISSVLEWFDRKRLLREIEMLTGSIADFDEQYEHQRKNWNNHYIVSGPFLNPVGGLVVLSNGVEVTGMAEGRILGEEIEWLNASELIIRETYESVTCIETLHPTGTWLSNERLKSPESRETLVQFVRSIMTTARRFDQDCGSDTRKTKQYAQVTEIRAFRNLASIHLAQRRLVHDTIYTVRLNAREILAMERAWPNHQETRVSGSVTVDIGIPTQDTPQYSTEMTLSLDTGVLRFF